MQGQFAPCWCAALLLVLSASPAYAGALHGDAWGRQRFAAAEQIRESLNGRVASERTRRDYQRVIDAYRRVYLGAPTCSKADRSAAAAGELLVEMARRFDDQQILRSAIEQFAFLRREYPTSRYRFGALFTTAEIYKDDLNDRQQARSAFEEFLRRYPRHHLADDAREALNELAEEAHKRDASRPKKDLTPRRAEKQSDVNVSARASVAESDDDTEDEKPERTEVKPGKLARVTGIRHWSTPEYTRVAIDLENGVQFESQRIDHPDRIFFDLKDTRLASKLVGKSFDADDAYLKKVRVAQFRPGQTRVVLEVADLGSYNASLLANPYRLVIELRGKFDTAATEKAILGGENHAPAQTASATTDARSQTSSTAVEDGANGTPQPAKALLADASVGTVSNPTLSKAPPVKKIVEADDGDDEETPQTATLKSDNSRSKTRSDKKSESPEAKVDEHNKPGPATANSTQAVPDEDTSAAHRSAQRQSRFEGNTRRKSAKSTVDIDAREAQPTAAGDRSLIRALGLKIGKIVIDPGHGGHDTGTIGPNGLEEKDLVLAVAKRLGKLLQSRMGAEVVYTRQDDTFIPLETRTAIANQEQADLFVSIHANSSRDPDARGVETYYLNFTSNADALEVAARENAASDKSIHELQDLVKKIALKEKIEESREFASDVQRALHSGLAARTPAIRDRGVKKAPFVVLIGANMPSILAEISFVSNPSDERKLETAEYRQRIAESLYRGISKYVNGLSGVRVASRIAKSEGQ